MRVLNLLASGGVGGIEQLCLNIGKYADYENIFCFLFEEGAIYEEMKERGYQVVSLVDSAESKFTLRKWKNLCDIAKDCDIVVTHHCTIALQLYYWRLCKKFKRIKHIMTVHSCFDKQVNYGYGSKIKNICAKFALTSAIRNSDKMIFVSDAGKRSYIEEFNLKDELTEVVYNGIEIQNYEHISRNRDYYRLTYIGRLAQVKGLQLLLPAVKYLKDNQFPIKLWIIGAGDYKDELIKLTKELNVQDCVEFTGVKRNIEEYLKQTDVFIYPSIWQEVFGISIVEAMSYGIPCVSNNVGGIPEIIKNGVNGFIADEKNAEGIYKAILKVINLYEIQNITAMQMNCRRTAEEFSIEYTVKNLKKIYEKSYK